MRRAFLLIVIIGIVLAIAVREIGLHRKIPLETAYVGTRGATVWNSTAEVRGSVAKLPYGQPVQIFQRDGSHVLINAVPAIHGWVRSKDLLSPALWQAALQLDKTTKNMEVQARGHTYVRSNLHMRPGLQWEVISTAPGGTPVDVFERKPVENIESQLHRSAASAPNIDDWWLVRASVKNAGSISGWLLARFVKLDLPEPLPRYQSSEDITIVAWFEINRAVDSTGAVMPEYLVMGTRDGEGRPCDFSLIRVYTWSPVRHHYATAFVERGLCGSLPVETTPAATPGGAAYFSFANIGLNGRENREYEMKLTSVRRIDAGANAARKGKRR